MNVERSCTQKARYRTPELAEKTAARATAERGVPIYVYCCPHCGWWHLSKRGPYVRRNVRRSELQR